MNKYSVFKRLNEIYPIGSNVTIRRYVPSGREMCSEGTIVKHLITNDGDPMIRVECDYDMSGNSTYDFSVDL